MFVLTITFAATLNDSQHALLLASKSNYTHLLEGTLLPGVSYPESLSSGLTSKRTSHKIAEQGRRNRMNEALKEMQSMLPIGGAATTVKANGHGGGSSNSAGDDEHDSPKNMSASASEAKAANSKAATVESAIEYIKSLQRDRQQMEQTLKGKDDEMTALRQRLQDAEIKLHAGSSDKTGRSSSAATDRSLSSLSPLSAPDAQAHAHGHSLQAHTSDGVKS